MAEQKFSMNFKMDGIHDVDDLAEQVIVWEKLAFERSQSGSLSADRKIYYRGVGEAMQAIRLQLTKMHVGLKPISRESRQAVATD